MPDAKRWLEPIARAQVPDVWLDALRRAEAPIPMPKHEHRAFRVAAILVAAALVLGLALFGLWGLDGNDGQPLTGPTGPLSTFTDPAGIPIAVQYPADWHAAVAQSPIGWTGVNPRVGLVVSNTIAAMPERSRGNQPGYLPGDPDLPSSYVTVQITRSEFVASTLLQDSPLPLSMNDAVATPGRKNFRYLIAVVGGRQVFISVEAGPDASDADLERADQVVASITSTSHAISPYDLAGPTVDGGQITAAYVSDRVVVIGAWASWCAPCRAEIVELRRIAAIYADNPNVLVLGIDVNDDLTAARAFLADHHATFQSLVAGPDVVAKLSLTTVPLSLVIDTRGRLHALQLSAPIHPGSRSAIRGQIRKIRATVDNALGARS
jgi:thiol-disulfide isomerase/thioredoxin